MKGVVVMVAVLAAGGFLERLTRETNSAAAASRGVENFSRRDYPAAVDALAKAASIAPGPQSAFNLGTAQVAAGQNQEGAATLDGAMNDPELRPDAQFNRGNSALNASAFEAAIRDYSDVLRLRPNDAAAKRNLEIALRRQQSSPKPSPQGEPQDQPEQNEGQEPEQGEPEDREAEALLRSVEQQEREELSRMRKASPSTRRIGW